MIRNQKHAYVESHSHNAAIAPPPFAFRAVDPSALTAQRHEWGLLFGEGEDVPHQIKCMQLLGIVTAEDGEQRGVFVQKSAIRGHAGNSVNGVFHQIAVPRLGLAQRRLRALSIGHVYGHDHGCCYPSILRAQEVLTAKPAPYSMRLPK